MHRGPEHPAAQDGHRQVLSDILTKSAFPQVGRSQIYIKQCKILQIYVSLTYLVMHGYELIWQKSDLQSVLLVHLRRAVCSANRRSSRSGDQEIASICQPRVP